MPGLRTLDQERAEYAWALKNSYRREYVTLVKGAPALVMGNGLMQAMAYYQDKNTEGKDLVAHVCGWLKKRNLVQGTDFSAAMKSLHQATSVEYVQATTEALEILKWIKQMGSAMTAEETYGAA